MEFGKLNKILGDRLTSLMTVLKQWTEAPPESRNFKHFEEQIRVETIKIEQAALAEGLAALDVDFDQIEVDGHCFRKMEGKRTATYCTLAGEISVERSLYRPDGKGRPICPLDLRAGVIEGCWTPRAAEVMAYSVALMTPYEAEEFIPKFGGLAPSRSSLDRLPKALSKRWEESRTAWEDAIRSTEVVPTAAGIVVASMDGVTVPMKDGERKEKREKALAEGKQTRGPAGYREAACGVVSIYSDHQERLQTTYCARMPESKKVTLQEQITNETSAVLAAVPCPILVLTSDGAPDNWRILEGMENSLRDEGVLKKDDAVYKIADFYHASQHLKRATDLFYGENSPASYGAHEELRRILRDEDAGVSIVVKRLTYFRNQSEGRKRDQLSTKLEYFRSRTVLMNYAEFQRLGLPIGTGVTEAACKTLVTQRMKRSGMRWGNPGGQAVLTLRSLLQSGRWQSGWEQLSKSYVTPVTKVTVNRNLPCSDAEKVAA